MSEQSLPPPQAPQAYRNAVNHLLDALHELSGFSRSSRYYWGLVFVSRELCHYSPRLLLTDVEQLARAGWLVWQMVFGVLSVSRPHLSDEDLANEMLRVFGAFSAEDLANGLPLCTPERLYAIPYRALDVKKMELNNSANKYCEKWLECVSLSRFPRLPATKFLQQIATTKLLRQGYFAGNYPKLLQALKLFDDDATVTLTLRVPSSVAVQFRLMHLLARGTADQFGACVILYAWERLGRSILHSAGGARTVTEAFDYFINNPTAVL